jgi:excinuclease ABC subunit A
VKESHITIQGARVHNLKNITLRIPRRKLVVVTGLSGSGKSSLAFDTLYAEGQRRYVESLSSYARQFLARMEKPDVDFIQGISPSLAIEQKTPTSNPRSTVGTTTEVFDYLKLLFARIGITTSPISGQVVTRQTVSDVVSHLGNLKPGSKITLLARLTVRKDGFKKELELALQKGFTRIWQDDAAVDIEDLFSGKLAKAKKDFLLLIGRVQVPRTDAVDQLDEFAFRLSDTVQTAYQEGQGSCLVQVDDQPMLEFSEKFERDGIAFEIPTVNLFSFNNPYGACRKCEGFGRILGIDEDLVIPDKSLSIFDGAVAAWRGEVMRSYQDEFIAEGVKLGFPIHRPWFELSPAEKDQVRIGLGEAWGYRKFFQYIEGKLHKIQYRVMLSRYRGFTSCPECNGDRLRKDASYVKVDGWSIQELVNMELSALYAVMQNLTLTETQKKISKRILSEIINRLGYLVRVGVGYLTLHRKINMISGGEMQRIRLATSLGSGLVGSLYVLDEPSIGLHPRDTERLVGILENLRDLGNSVIVVEHDESVIRKADEVIDMGPGAGEHGGHVVFQGNHTELKKSDTLTAKYMRGELEISVPTVRRKKTSRLLLKGAMENNLKGVDAEFPLHAMTVVTGVSGSGKSTLVSKILYPALRIYLEEYGEKPGFYKSLTGDLSLVKGIELVDQSPIGRSTRSNPVTYVKAWDHVRELFSNQPLAKMRDLKPGAFSFNVEGGRCETCKGDGQVTIEMQFLPDIVLRCDVCHGKRFRKPVLEVKYKDKNVDDVLNMTITEGVTYFADEPKIVMRLEILDKVGLGYLRMGQSSDTLSGGEAQRLKLALFLSQAKERRGTFYIFDEPTTGLHMDDIRKLLSAMNQLIEQGNTVLVVEHNLDVIKCADWLIDLGPEGGNAGGKIIYQGVPEGVVEVKESWTGKYLAGKLGAVLK